MRAWMLVVLVLVVSTGCAAVPDTVACAHCACDPSQRTLSRPLLCTTFQRDALCCTVVPPSS